MGDPIRLKGKPQHRVHTEHDLEVGAVLKMFLIVAFFIGYDLKNLIYYWWAYEFSVKLFAILQFHVTNKS